MSNKLVISGASGFVGTNLIKELVGIDKVLLDRSKLKNLNSFSFRPNDDFIHLAAHVHNMNVKNKKKDEEVHFQVNRDLSVKLFKKFMVESQTGKFIFISTVHTHSKETNGVFKINQKCSPDSAYGKSKLEAEIMMEEIASSPEFRGNLIILRLPMIYGPGNKGNILKFIKLATLGIKLPLKGFSKKRSLIYVGNLIFIIKKLLNLYELEKMSKLYVTDIQDLSSSDIFNQIYRLINNRDGVFYIPIIFFSVIAQFITFLERILKVNLIFNVEVFKKLENEYRFEGKATLKLLNIDELPYSFTDGIEKTVKYYTES